jgi:hypothetical protein
MISSSLIINEHWFHFQLFIIHIHVFLTSALVGGEWLTSRLRLFAAGERVPGTNCIGGWVDPRPILDDLKKRKFFTLPGLELRPLDRPARNPSPCGRAIAVAVSGWLPAAAARVRARVWQVGFVVDKVVSGQIFSECFGFPYQNRSFHQLLHPHTHPGQVQ